jgi:hypothetical protein
MTTIRVDDSTHQKLKALTDDGESLDETVQRVIEAAATLDADMAAALEAASAPEDDTERLADSVLTMREKQYIESREVSPVQYLQDQYGVDPDDYESEAALLAALGNSDGDPGPTRY